MEAVTVTVIKGGWWLPGRALVAGETLTLDAATAEALARRGIVRLEPPAVPDVASNAGTNEASAPIKTRKARKETAQ